MNSIRHLTHETPGDLLRNEEKWFRFLSLKSLVAICIACVPGLGLFLILKAYGHALVGAVIWALLVIAAYVLTSVVLPPERYAYTGGGQYLYIILIRKIYRRMTRCTYIKNYGLFTGGKGGRQSG